MTDLETLQAMFDRADVGYSVGGEPGSALKTHPTTTQVLETDTGLGSAEPRGTGNLGYFGFFTDFGFDAEGKLLWVGAWE